MLNLGIWEFLTCFVAMFSAAIPCLLPGFVAQRRGRQFWAWFGIGFLLSLAVLVALLVAYGVAWFVFDVNPEETSIEDVLPCCPLSPCLAPFTGPLATTILLLAMPAKARGTGTGAPAEPAHPMEGAVAPAGVISPPEDVPLEEGRAPREGSPHDSAIPPPALHEAAAEGNVDALRALLAAGSDPNAPDDKEGWTPLHWAVQNGHIDAARLLLDKGAYAGAQYKQRAAPLHLAAAGNRVDAAELLLARGAEPNQRDFAGRAPLRTAAARGGLQVAELLLDRGAIVDLRADDGMTPLHAAALNNRTDLVRLLLQRGARVNAQSGSGSTALHAACLNGNAELVQVLIGAGADASIADNNGETALQWCQSEDMRKMLHGPA